MSLTALHLVDFRCFEDAWFEPSPHGTTVITGPNGTGKTSVLEGIGYLGTQRSFRAAPREVMVRAGCERAVVRAEVIHDERPSLVEAELVTHGRSRLQVNRQSVGARRELGHVLAVSVFSPEDLSLVQGGPSHRRDLLDGALGILHPRAGALVEEVERTLRQRGALLRQASGRLTPEVEATLAVWDERLASSGTALANTREQLCGDLQPYAAAAYRALAGGADVPSGHVGGPEGIALSYRRSWDRSLGDALAVARSDDLRRAANTVGPHRDELVLTLAGRDARLQASQGEQRCVALALRLGVHRLVTDRAGRAPLLLLDDVFSELDPARSSALVHELPDGQALLTTAVPLPPGIHVASVVDVTSLGPSRESVGTARTGTTP